MRSYADSLVLRTPKSPPNIGCRFSEEKTGNLFGTHVSFTYSEDSYQNPLLQFLGTQLLIFQLHD